MRFLFFIMMLVFLSSGAHAQYSAQPVSQYGTWNVGLTGGSITLPTGASTSALQTTGNSSLSSIDGKLPSTLGQKTMANSLACVLPSDQSAIGVTGTFWQATQPVSGPLTDAQLRASAVPVSGPLTDSELRASPVPISGSLTNISGTISLPTGASTAAKQDTGNTSLSSIDTKAVNMFPTASDPVFGSNSTLVLDVSGMNTAMVTYQSFDRVLDTIEFYYSINGVDYDAAWCVDVGANDGQIYNFTLSTTLGPFRCNVSGAKYFKIHGTYTSATTNPVQISASTGFSVIDGNTGQLYVTVGTSALPSGAATETSLAKLTQTQGSTTSGQSGPLVQGAVTTAAPSYTTAQTRPLSLNTAGGLRVEVASALPAGTNAIGKLSANSGIDIGDVDVTSLPALPAGTNNIGDVDIASAIPTGTNSIGQVTANAGTNLNTSALALDATLSTMSGKLPATLGAKTTANSMAVNIASDQTVPISGTVTVNSALVSTYSYSNGATTFTPVATPNAMITIQGSGTKTVKIYSFLVCATATAAGHAKFYLARRSAAPTGGTSAAVTANKRDTNDANATAVVNQYSVDPTSLSGLVGVLQGRWMYYGITAGTTIENGCVDMIRGHGEDYNDNTFKPYTLRGTSEYLNFEKNDEALPAGFAIQSYRIILTEE